MTNLILDIDGTLWNTTDVVAKAWNDAIAEKGIRNLTITAAMLRREFGKPMNVIADDLFVGMDEETKAELLNLCCQHEQKEIAENHDDLTYPGVRETMQKLAATCRLYIVSNCQNGYIELVIEKNHLEGLIQDSECFGRTNLSKGQNIKLLMERNHLKEAYYVGDTMGDYEAAREAGVPFVFAKYGFGEVATPDEVIDEFAELKRFV